MDQSSNTNYGVALIFDVLVKVKEHSPVSIKDLVKLLEAGKSSNYRARIYRAVCRLEQLQMVRISRDNIKYTNKLIITYEPKEQVI